MRIGGAVVMLVLVFFVIDERDATFPDLCFFFARQRDAGMYRLARIVRIYLCCILADRAVQGQLYAGLATLKQVEHVCTSRVGYEACSAQNSITLWA